MTNKDPQNSELEAVVFRRLVAHLQERTDVQNIDLMNLSGFVETVFQDGTLKLLKNRSFHR